MFLILCFIDKKIFVYSEKEIKSNVGKENETSKTNTVSAHILNLWSKQNWKGRYEHFEDYFFEDVIFKYTTIYTYQ